MRIRSRLDRIEQLLAQRGCAYCAVGGHYDIACQPNGWDTEPRITFDGQSFPDRCPACNADLLRPGRPVKRTASINPVWV